MRSRLLALCATIAASLSLAPTLTAQTTGAVAGRILGPDAGPLAGATVTVAGAVPGARLARSDVAGRYHLPALPPGSYSLHVALTGFSPQDRTVIVSLGATTTVDLSLTPQVVEKVTVLGESPLVDTGSVAMASLVPAQAFVRIPLARDYASIAVFQPGVSRDGVGVSVFGATGLENAYFIDGVDVTGVRSGAQQKVVPEEFVQEVQVQTATYPAEYGGAFGGVVNAITRSGGNDYHGEAFGYFDDQNLQARAKPGVEGGNFAGFANRDFGASLGGYLMRDRLWFFGVFDHTFLRRDVRLVSGSGSQYDGSTFRSQDRSSNLYAGKLTWAVSQSLTLVGSVIGDPTTDAQQLVEDGPPESRRLHERSGRPDASLIATATGPWWVSEIGLFSHRERRDRSADFQPPFLTSDDSQVPMLDLANCNLPGCYSGAPWVFIPTAEPLLSERLQRRQARGSFTGFHGRHEFKTGFELAQTEGEVSRSIPGGFARIVNRLADGTILHTQVWFGDESGLFGTDHVAAVVGGRPKTDSVALYAQDSWTPRTNLTVDVGLRYEDYRLFDAVTGGTLTSLRNNFAPRLGVSWDPHGAGREKVTLAYGRFFQPVPLNHQAGSFRGSSLSITDVLGFSFDCGPTAIDCESFPNRFAEPADSRLKAPLAEQLSAGFEMKIGDRLKLGVNAIYSRLLRALEDRCDLQGNDAALAFTGNGCVLMNPGLGLYGTGVFPPFSLGGGAAEEILCTNGLNPEEGRASITCPALPRARRSYQGLALTVEQRYSASTYFLASYVYSRLRGNYDGSYNELGQASPNTNFDFDYPGLLANANGRLANDRPHQLKVTGFHTLPLGLSVGVNAYYRSGIPKDKLGSFALIQGAPVPLYLEPRGSQGREPADWDLDLHLDYPVKVGGFRVGLIADVFRLFNKQSVLRTDPFFNADGFQADNSVQTNPNYGTPILRADPRLVRVGLRVWF